VALPADKHSGEAGGAAGAAGEESLARLLQLLVGQPPPLPRSDTGCSGGGSSADASGSWAAAAAAPSPSALAAQRLAAAQLAARAAAAQQERLLLDPHLAGQVSQLQHQLHPPSRRMADSAAARLFAAPHGLASLVAAPSTSSLASAATFAGACRRSWGGAGWLRKRCSCGSSPAQSPTPILSHWAWMLTINSFPPAHPRRRLGPCTQQQRQCLTLRQLALKPDPRTSPLGPLA
jgi:hypothetical protein